MSVRYGDDDIEPISEEEKPKKKGGKKNKKNKKSNKKQEPAVDYDNSEVDEDAGDKYQYDPNFNGIDEDRHCTDICMLLIFILFICGMLALLFLALTKSNPKFLYIPTDYRNLLCGYDNSKLKVENSSNFPDLTDYPYLFWTRPGKKGYVRSYCVKKCPTEGYFTDAFYENKKAYEGGEKDSVCGIPDEKNKPKGTKRTVRGYDLPFVNEKDSVKYYCAYKTVPVISRCMPTNDTFKDIIEGTSETLTQLNETIFANFTSMMTTNTLMTAVNDVMITYPYIAASAGITLLVSFIWIILMRYTAACFVWVTVLLAIAASAGLTYICWGQKENKWMNVGNAEAYTFGLYNDELNKNVFNVLFIICCVWDAILFLLCFFLFGRIKKSIAIIKIVSITFSQVKTLFFFPVIIYIIMFIWWIYVVGVAIVLFGAGNATSVNSEELGLMIEYKYDNLIAGLSIYHFFGFLWISIFIADLGEVSLAGVFASWYFAREPRREHMDKSPVWGSFKRALRYHAGSIAFGSLIITVIKAIRLVIEYIREKTKDTDNDAIKCLLKCFACCCWCFEKFMKYINRNAYILIAVHGYNFFTGCKKAFGLLLRNCINVATINWVGDFTLFLGRVFVTGLVTGLSCVFFAHMEKVVFYVVPAFFVAIVAFFASDAFTELFEMGIDSMFLCYMEDIERNDGSDGHELYGPEDLIKYVSNSKRKDSDDE